MITNLLIIQLFLALILLLFSIFIWRVSYTKNTKKATETPVSILIYTKNQSNQLKKLIPNLLTQEYLQFEIVIINHTSTDETTDYVKDLVNTHQNIALVDIAENEKFWNNKRFALTLGIKKAKYEHLVFIDANTTITSNLWLKNLLKNNSSSTHFIIGSTKPQQLKSKAMYRYQYLKTQLLSFAFSKQTQPFILDDRNLVYTKTTFYNNRGYINHMNYYGHAHELFFLETATHKNANFTTEHPIEIALPYEKKEWKEFRKSQSSLFSKIPLSSKTLYYLLFLTKFALIINTSIALYFCILENDTIGFIFASTLLLFFSIYWISISKYMALFTEHKLKWQVPFYETLSFFNKF